MEAKLVLGGQGPAVVWGHGDEGRGGLAKKETVF